MIQFNGIRCAVEYRARSSSKDKNKEVKINVRVTSGRDLQFWGDTRLRVKIGAWDKERQKSKSAGDPNKAEELNTQLRDLRAVIEDDFKEKLTKGELPPDWIETVIDKFHNPGKYIIRQITLFSFIKDFIAKADSRINPKTGRPVCYKMAREYERTFYYLKEFSQNRKSEPDFADIDLEFYEDFVTYLQKEKLATNTIGKKIQTLKIFLNNATEKGINTNYKFKSSKFISISEEADTVYLTEEEINTLYKKDFSENQRLEKIRDLFIIGCRTGLRFSDLSRLTMDHVKDDFFYITQQKTDSPVVIPIHPQTRQIMTKYGNELPRVISNQKFNKYLQEAAKKAKINEVVFKTITKGGVRITTKHKKHELITTHTARRSFATNLYNQKFPVQSIMAITGHKTEKAFLKYLKVTPAEHAKLLQEFWINQKSHLKVV